MQVTEIQVNMNDKVRLKLLPGGREMMCNYWEPVGALHGKSGESICAQHHPGWKDGVIELQLWEAFHIFGPALGHPQVSNTIDTNITILKTVY